MACAWARCGHDGVLRNIQYPDGCHVLTICTDHLPNIREELRQTWQVLSDAGNLDATVALILLDESFDHPPAAHPHLHAARVALSRRNWGQVRALLASSQETAGQNVESAFTGLLVAVIFLAMLAGLYGIAE